MAIRGSTTRNIRYSLFTIRLRERGHSRLRGCEGILLTNCRLSARQRGESHAQRNPAEIVRRRLRDPLDLLMWWSRGPMDHGPARHPGAVRRACRRAVVLALRQVVPLVHRAPLIKADRQAQYLPARLELLLRRRPEIPGRVEQVDADTLAARPGVPELLRVERAFRCSRDFVERDAECQLKITGST